MEIKSAPAFVVLAKTLKDATPLGKVVLFNSCTYSITANQVVIRCGFECRAGCSPHGKVTMDLDPDFPLIRDQNINDMSANPNKVFEAIKVDRDKKTVRTKSNDFRITNLKFTITRDHGHPHVNISWIDKHVRGMTNLLEASGLKVLEGNIHER